MYETSNTARYAMTFEKNKTINYTNVEPLSSLRTLESYNLAPLLNTKHVFSVHSQLFHARTYRLFTKYVLSQISELSTQLISTPSINLVLYTNLIMELYFTNTSSSLKSLTHAKNAPYINSQTLDTLTAPIKITHTKPQQTPYNLPILNG
jgi:hypothetical protein